MGVFTTSGNASTLDRIIVLKREIEKQDVRRALSPFRRTTVILARTDSTGAGGSNRLCFHYALSPVIQPRRMKGRPANPGKPMFPNRGEMSYIDEASRFVSPLSLAARRENQRVEHARFRDKAEKGGRRGVGGRGSSYQWEPEKEVDAPVQRRASMLRSPGRGGLSMGLPSCING